MNYLRRALAGIAFVWASLSLAACGGDDDDQKLQAPTEAMLPEMVLHLEELGDDYQGFLAFEGNIILDNKMAVETDPDPEGERLDLEQGKRVTGIARRYFPSPQTSLGLGIDDATTAVNLHEDVDGATFYFNDIEEELKAEFSREPLSLETFDPGDLGDQREGLLVTFPGPSPTYLTSIGFRIENLIATVNIGHHELTDDIRQRAVTLAKELEKRIAAVRTGTASPHDKSEPAPVSLRTSSPAELAAFLENISGTWSGEVSELLGLIPDYVVHLEIGEDGIDWFHEGDEAGNCRGSAEPLFIEDGALHAQMNVLVNPESCTEPLLRLAPEGATLAYDEYFPPFPDEYVVSGTLQRSSER